MTKIEAAFCVSKRVYNKEIGQTEGAQQLFQDVDINVNSAKIMISVYAKMMKGLEFKRALSATDMDYYLARIMEEGGQRALINPIKGLWNHIEYYEAKNNVNLIALRELYLKYSNISVERMSLEDTNAKFEHAVEEAKNVSKAKRQEYLNSSPRTPKSRTVLVNIYERNPYVVAEVLERANGICEKCGCPAPFRKRKDNSPYLEVHHKIRLADGGDDTVENAIALCPNCHRELHFGLVQI